MLWCGAMEFVALAAALVAAAAAIAVLVVVLRRGDSGAGIEILRTAQNEMAGRMSQLSEQGNQAQVAITKTLNERLEQSAVKTAETLGDIKKHLNVIDQAQKTMGELTADVVSLQEILSNKQLRGKFGETQLLQLVADRLPKAAYEIQPTLSNKRRPDCLLKLPNPPGSIVIDAKFPLESYRALSEATDDEAVKTARRSFIQDIRKHIKDIAERYILPGETADQALMFLPSETVFSELHANFGGLVEESQRARVWIVSPSTMWALLHTVRAVFRDAYMHEQAALIQSEVYTLLIDVGRLGERVGNLESSFAGAQEAIRQIRISAEKVTRRGEKIDSLQFGEKDDGGEAQPAD